MGEEISEACHEQAEDQCAETNPHHLDFTDSGGESPAEERRSIHREDVGLDDRGSVSHAVTVDGVHAEGRGGHDEDHHRVAEARAHDREHVAGALKQLAEGN